MRITALHRLIVGALFYLSGNLIVLWTTALFLHIVTLWLRLAIFKFRRLNALVCFVCHVLFCSLHKFAAERNALTTLATALSAAGLPAAFGRTAAAGSFTSTLLVSTAASVWLPSRSTAAPVARLFLFLLRYHRARSLFLTVAVNSRSASPEFHRPVHLPGQTRGVSLLPYPGFVWERRPSTLRPAGLVY